MVRGVQRRLLMVGFALLCVVGSALGHSAVARAAGTADLQVTLNGPANVNEGEDAVYTAVVHNAGPDTATGVVVIDQAPAGFELDPSQSFSGCTQNGTTVTCPLNEGIPSSVQLAPQIAFRTSTTGTFTTTVSATETATDPTPDNDTASMDTTVNPPVSADVAVGWVGAAQVNDGQAADLFLDISNNGPDTSPGASLVISVPPGLSPGFSGCTASGSGQTCTQSIGSMPPGVSEFGRFTFGTSATGQYSVTATITGEIQDPESSNNSASTTVTVAPAADLSVSLGWNGQAQQPYAGQRFDLLLSVHNGGPDASAGDVVTLSVPTGITPNFGGCSTSASGVTCALQMPDQPLGTTVMEQLPFTASAEGQYTVSTSVAGAEYDPNSSNNATALPVTIQPAADVAVVSSATPNPVVAGHKVTVEIVLTNNGPSTAPGVSWSTTWGSDAKGGVAFDGYSVSGGTCSASDATVSCQPGDLASGQQVTLTIVLQPRSKGTLVIDSSASSSISDPSTGNNSSETAVTIG